MRKSLEIRCSDSIPGDFFMGTQIVAGYCLCDDMLNRLQHRDAPQGHISHARIMTVGIVVALGLGSNSAKEHLSNNGYSTAPVSASRHNCRIHRTRVLVSIVFAMLAEH